LLKDKRQALISVLTIWYFWWTKSRCDKRLCN